MGIDDMRPGTAPDGLLSRGHHVGPSHGSCLMEYVSLLAGERFSDRPQCTHPALACLARHVNDNVGDGRRGELVRLAPGLVGAAGGGDVVWDIVTARCLAAALDIDPTAPDAHAQVRRIQTRRRQAERRGNLSRLLRRVRRISTRPESALVTACAALSEALLARRCPPHTAERVQIDLLDTASTRCVNTSDSPRSPAWSRSPPPRGTAGPNPPTHEAVEPPEPTGRDSTERLATVSTVSTGRLRVALVSRETGPTGRCRAGGVPDQTSSLGRPDRPRPRDRRPTPPALAAPAAHHSRRHPVARSAAPVTGHELEKFTGRGQRSGRSRAAVPAQRVVPTVEHRITSGPGTPLVPAGPGARAATPPR